MNRHDRRAIARRVRATVRADGCACTPKIFPDRDGDAGWIQHDIGCPLGERCVELLAHGIVLGVPVVAPRCER